MRPPARRSPNAQEQSPASPVPLATAASSRPVPTPSVFDLATLPRSSETEEGTTEKRFPTSEWFTEEDQRHPELYFELAERMPKLNRPAERRDTLAFFLAYREKLRRDLDVSGENQDKRQEILATIERYDGAIVRLRELIDSEGAHEPRDAPPTASDPSTPRVP